MILDFLGFAALLILILFGITLAGVGGFFLVRTIGENLREKPFRAFESRVKAAIQAADLGCLAIACGPLLGFFISLAILPVALELAPREPHPDPHAAVMMLFLMTGVGLVAGVISGSAFWVSSALLGKVRKVAKRREGIWDSDFDGPV